MPTQDAPMGESKSITLTFTPDDGEIYTLIKQAAEKDERSVSKFIVRYLRSHFAPTRPIPNPEAKTN